MRTHRILGLILMAALLLVAWAAPSARADLLTAESYPATLTGTAASPSKFLTTSGTVSCSGTKATMKKLAGAAAALAAIFNFLGSECTAFGFPSTVDSNECGFVFNIQGGASTSGDIDLFCPAGKSMTVTAISAGTVKCTVHVSPQSDITGTATGANLGSGATREISLQMNLSGIDYSHTKGTGLGACTAGSSTTGTLTAETIFTGESEAGGSHIGIFLS